MTVESDHTESSGFFRPAASGPNSRALTQFREHPTVTAQTSVRSDSVRVCSSMTRFPILSVGRCDCAGGVPRACQMCQYSSNETCAISVSPSHRKKYMFKKIFARLSAVAPSDQEERKYVLEDVFWVPECNCSARHLKLPTPPEHTSEVRGHPRTFKRRKKALRTWGRRQERPRC